VRRDDHTDAVAGIRLTSGEAFVQDTRQRIDVGPVGHLVAGEPFRSHVGVSAHRGAEFGELLVGGGVRDAEIDQVREIVAGDDDVLGFDVTVHDPALVRRIKSRGDLLHDRHRASRRQRPVRLEHLAKVFAVDHAHVDVQQTVDLAVVVDRHDMGFLQAAGGMRFALQSLAEHRIVGRRLRQQLQRDDAVLDRVLGLVDLAHTALAQQAPQFVGADLRTNA
jgi:hypothetical protein